MKFNRRMILSIFWVLLGAVLSVLGITERIDSFWSGMGGGLLAVGIIHTVRNIKYVSDEEYREKTDVANKDERNRFISGKAWAWAGYLFVFVGAVGSIALKLIGREDMMLLASSSVCLILILYWICYLILNKKY